MTRMPLALASLVLLGMTAACSGSTASSADSGGTSGTSNASSPAAASSPAPSPSSSAPSASPSASASSGGSSPTSDPGPTAPAPVTGKPVSITIASGGDLIPHPAVLTTARRLAGGHGFDFGPMFAASKPVLEKADLAICQLETPLSVTDNDVVFNAPPKAPRFTAPHEFATAVKNAGYAGCSTGNNHAYDNGFAGLAQTRTVMKNVGLKDAGPAPDAADRVAWYDVKGARVAQLSYSWTLSNRIGDQTYAPPAAPWLTNNLYSVVGVAGILRDAKAAREQGADFVIVSMHWGVEQTRTLSHDQLTFGPALLKSGLVDFIIGNHPHVVQQCSQVDGRYVVYSEGNQLSQQGPPYFQPMAQDGVITTVTLSRDTAGAISEKLTYQPTYVDKAVNFTVALATPGNNPASYNRTVAAIKGDGSCNATPAG